MHALGCTHRTWPVVSSPRRRTIGTHARHPWQGQQQHLWRPGFTCALRATDTHARARTHHTKPLVVSGGPMLVGCTLAVNKFNVTSVLWQDDFSFMDYSAWSVSQGDGTDFGIPGESSCSRWREGVVLQQQQRQHMQGIGRLSRVFTQVLTTTTDARHPRHDGRALFAGPVAAATSVCYRLLASACSTAHRRLWYHYACLTCD